VFEASFERASCARDLEEVRSQAMTKIAIPVFPTHCAICGREIEHLARKVERLNRLKVTTAAIHKNDRTPSCA
jgi:hypothetical protein